MQDSIQTQQAPATPQASIPSSAPAPTQAYQSTPAQSANLRTRFLRRRSRRSATSRRRFPRRRPQTNPWQQAFERLSDSLSATRAPNRRQPTQRRPHRQPFTGRGMAGFGSGASSGSFRIGAADLIPKQRRRTPRHRRRPTATSRRNSRATSISQASATKVLKFSSTSERGASST